MFGLLVWGWYKTGICWLVSLMTAVVYYFIRFICELFVWVVGVFCLFVLLRFALWFEIGVVCIRRFVVSGCFN